MSSRSTKIPYVMKKGEYIQITIQGRPFSMNSSHPTFNRMQRALERKRWKSIPKLISIAEAISTDTGGNIKVKDGKLFYKGKETHTTIAERIIELLNHGRPVKPLLKFMDNLYQNPSHEAISEFYGWLERNELPITTDGGFLAYKSVNEDFTDCHTGTIDNSPGQIIFTSRNKVDRDWRTQCSSGYHLCSKYYGRYGAHTLAVLTYPQYVLSAEGGKIRVTWYESLKNLGTKDTELFKKEGFADIERKLVVEGKGELVKLLLGCPEIKRNIRKKKLKISTLRKYSTLRLKEMIKKRNLFPEIGPGDNRFLEAARKASGLTIGQVAKQMGVTYKAVALLEKKQDPPQDRINSFAEAIAKLTGVNLTRGAITYPKVMQVAN